MGRADRKLVEPTGSRHGDDGAIKLSATLAPGFTIEKDRPSERQHPSDVPGKKLIAEAWVGALRQRNQAFPAGIFADPAWDILLDLYLAYCDRRDVSVTNACVASNVPPTTALRWITILLDKRLVTRANDPRDCRRKMLNLTEDGLAMIEAALEGAARSDRRLGLDRLRLTH